MKRIDTDRLERLMDTAHGTKSVNLAREVDERFSSIHEGSCLVEGFEEAQTLYRRWQWQRQEIFMQPDTPPHCPTGRQEEQEEWQEEQTAEPPHFHCSLSERRLAALFERLRAEGFLDGACRAEDWQYCFGGGELPTGGFQPLIWTARNSRNKGVNKKALLDLLELMGVDEAKQARQSTKEYFKDLQDISFSRCNSAVTHFATLMEGGFGVSYPLNKLKEIFKKESRSEHFFSLKNLIKGLPKE